MTAYLCNDALKPALQPGESGLTTEGDVAAKAKVAARKQALRDITAYPAIEAATTPEELALVVPAALAEA